jgi:AcrR family transcriptional regulator
LSRPRTISDADILAAAARVIGEVGPARLTLALVAQAAGLSAATLVQRFGSRRSLLLHLAESAADEARTAVARARAAAASPRAAARHFL